MLAMLRSYDFEWRWVIDNETVCENEYKSSIIPIKVSPWTWVKVIKTGTDLQTSMVCIDSMMPSLKETGLYSNAWI